MAVPGCTCFKGACCLLPHGLRGLLPTCAHPKLPVALPALCCRCPLKAGSQRGTHSVPEAHGRVLEHAGAFREAGAPPTYTQSSLFADSVSVQMPSP